MTAVPMEALPDVTVAAVVTHTVPAPDGLEYRRIRLSGGVISPAPWLCTMDLTPLEFMLK